MLTILAGKTCSGKDTIKKILVDQYGYEPIVTYTTRPMRPGEKQHETYHFVSTNKFLQMKQHNEFAETTSYVVTDGLVWHYGTPINELQDDNKIIILNPSGVKQIKNMPQIEYKIIYIDVCEGVIKNRLRFRGDNDREASRRILSDNRDFKDFEYDYKVKNDGEMTPELAAELINEFIKKGIKK